ncbi:hypothetical protein CN445_17180 [Bacillus cereus]|uniref:Uncharacterized protein n=1 Tax=Bacillus cereus TaxID=1396 RepID=A0A2A9QL61_BACCE|nr:hypothetical protein COM83_22335 [Bacillus cereus]PEA24512.1 hypothetical protein CON44_25745 [Bacillus cereus]PEB80008.1 hypothetical protein COM95_19965 [Bacillus cereus]PEQ30245.1 hypothetical protein CN467_26870 [Bacillus cereus]PER24217.1 hypothetical protein CN485_22425 [Bacillus cereus]
MSLYDIQKCIEEIVNQYEEEKLVPIGIFHIESSFK